MSFDMFFTLLFSFRITIEFPNANLLFTTFERSELESLETDSRFHPLSDSNVARIAAIGKPRK